MKKILLVISILATNFSFAYTVDEELLKKCVPKDVLTAGQKCNPSSSEYPQEDKWNCSPMCSWYQKRIKPITSDRNLINTYLIGNQIRMYITFNTGELTNEEAKNTFVTMSIVVDKDGHIIEVSQKQISNTPDSYKWANAIKAAIMDRKGEVTVLSNSIKDKTAYDITFRP